MVSRLNSGIKRTIADDSGAWEAMSVAGVEVSGALAACLQNIYQAVHAR
jgi:hypothetical protein